MKAYRRRIDASNISWLPSSFGVTVLDDAEIAVVVAGGEMDVLAAPQLSSALTQAIASSPAVLIDLSECSFIDSNGLGALLDAVRHARTSQVRLAVVCLPDGASRALFDLVFGPAIFTTCDTRSAGLQALRASDVPGPISPA